MASIAVPFGLHVYKKWPATPMLPPPPGGDPNYMNDNYFMPWCRFSPYIGGIVLGYILYRTKDKEIKIPRVNQKIHYIQSVVQIMALIIEILRRIRSKKFDSHKSQNGSKIQA